MNDQTPHSLLITGATGYIGGRLIPQLLDQGYTVRVFVRDADRIQGRVWLEGVDVVEGDVLEPGTLPPALNGIDAAYYLIHNMSEEKGYRRQEIISAQNFGTAAHEAGVDRIIYLGGLGDPQEDLAPHLRSRQATGEELAKHGACR